MSITYETPHYFDANTFGMEGGKIKHCFEIGCKNCDLNSEPQCHEAMAEKLKGLPSLADLSTDDQSVKADGGKPKLSLAPIEQTWRAIAEVREYGVQKYKDPNNWKKVALDRYYDALFRHIAATVTDHNSVDKESGIRHLKHALCNIAFILELEAEQEQEDEKRSLD